MPLSNWLYSCVSKYRRNCLLWVNSLLWHVLTIWRDTCSPKRMVECWRKNLYGRTSRGSFVNKINRTFRRGKRFETRKSLVGPMRNLHLLGREAPCQVRLRHFHWRKISEFWNDTANVPLRRWTIVIRNRTINCLEGTKTSIKRKRVYLTSIVFVTWLIEAGQIVTSNDWNFSQNSSKANTPSPAKK